MTSPSPADVLRQVAVLDGSSGADLAARAAATAARSP